MVADASSPGALGDGFEDRRRVAKLRRGSDEGDLPLGWPGVVERSFDPGLVDPRARPLPIFGPMAPMSRRKGSWVSFRLDLFEAFFVERGLVVSNEVMRDAVLEFEVSIALKTKAIGGVENSNASSLSKPFVEFESFVFIIPERKYPVSIA